MCNFRRAAHALIIVLLFCLPFFSQTPAGWPLAGNDLNNSRWASAETTLNSQNVGGLTVKWKFTTQNDVSATPSVDATGGYVYFPDWSGNLYKLNAATGATVWTQKMTNYGFNSAVMSRTTPTLYGTMVIVGASTSLASPNSFGAYLLALNSSDGSLIWSTQLDPDLNAVSTGSPIVYNGIAYVGVSSSEERLTNPTFRGSLVAISLTNGQILWQTHFVPAGYSGAPVWSSTPVIDVTRSQIYVTTGNNYLVPPSVQVCEQAANGNQKAILACQASNNYEDSIVALDLATGNVKWGHRCEADDAWITACNESSTACADPAGADLDFGSGANLFTATINGVPTQLVGAGQKSGVYWALSPVTGALQWYTSVGPSGKVGGMEWGTASDNQRIYVAISNSSQTPYLLEPLGIPWAGGSWAALNPATGGILWQVPDPGFNTVHPSKHSMALGPVTVANGVVYAASMSGNMYAFNAATGATLWSFLAPGSVNAAPAVVNGTLYWGTGYHNFPAANPFGTASNTFYAFSLPGNVIAPVTVACAANTGQVGAPYSSALAAAGGVPPYTFTIAAGSLPPGLTLNSSTGLVSGTPTAPGSFPYTIQVADSTGTQAGTATSSCGIAIAPAPVTLACAANAGQLGVPYSSALAAAGGVAPYTFSFTTGALPPGLTLNSSTGVICGTPNSAGNFPFTAEVVDSTGTPAGTATSSCGIAIAAQQTSTTLAVAPNPAWLGQPVTLTAQISPPPGTGSVSFYDGVAVLDSVAVVGGSASLTTSLQTAAVHNLRASYNANPSYAGSASTVTPLGVTALPSSTLLPAAPYLANGAGTWAAVGDFNGDGKADFVVANSGVSVWLGNGDGTFQAPINSASGASPVALATADFNGDGLLDVAAVYASGSVAILLGNGNGTFQAPVDYAAGSGQSGIAQADFNGDGVPDLAVANAGGVSLLLGNGDGTFQAAVNYAAGSGPAAVAAGDFIGNGKADLAVVNAAGGSVSVLLGNGDGTFQAAVSYAVAANPQAVALGDLNGDGRPDLVVANNAANSVSVLLGNGDGTFQAAVSYAAGANPQSVAVADVNGDGLADVVAANSGGGNLSVLLGNGDGTLQTAMSFGAGAGPVSLALADFNGDSRADVVAAGAGGYTAEVLLGGQAATSVALSASPNPAGAGQSVTLTGTVTPAAPFFGLPTGTLTFLDNGTALPGGTVGLSGGSAAYTATSLAPGANPLTGSYSGDAAFQAGTSATLTETVDATQTISFGSIPNQTYGSAPFPVAATASSGLPVSFTASGSCTVSGNIVTLTGVGSCTITANQPGNAAYAPALPVSQGFTIAPEPESLTLSVPASPVQQGQTVVLSAQLAPAPGTGAMAVFYDGATVLGFASAASGSATFTTSLLLPGPHNLRAYFPGNPNLPSVSSSIQPLTVSALPSAAFAAGVTYTAGVNPMGIAVGDFNLDGWPDLVVANDDTNSGSTDSVSVFLNNGNGTFAAAQNYQVDTGTTGVGVGDFNGDGIPDLVVVSATSQRLTVMQGNGNGTFTAGTQHFSAGTSPVRLAVADFNGDGAIDIAVVNKSSNNVSVLLGNGNLTFQNAVNYPVGTTPYAVTVGDFNLDGIPDLAVSNEGSNNVTILLGNGNGTFQPGVSYPVGASPSYLAIADLNGDGKPDLVVANTNSNTLSVLLGNGDGTLQAAVNYPAVGAPVGIVAVDVNGDGNVDLVATGYGGNEVMVLPGNGDGTFQASVAYLAGSKPMRLAAADFNRDGRTDIATANYGSNSMSVLLGNTAATSTTLTSSANPSEPGAAVTFKALVHIGAAAFATPSGTVTFADGGTVLSGGTVALNGTSASFTISTLAPGTHSITAAYSGDARFAASTSAALKQMVH
ncbi:MAG TPA: FG-GAP-like repeat-containing protein [Bryobacteraceae bacterium]|jgi:outer membrane protein assembly factor BamB|nr:FG-GAP-like repeat-containing protein [Bryobacteraceae bacterium]